MTDRTPFSELAQYDLDRASIRRLPEPFCRRNHVVVLDKLDGAAADEPVTVGMLTPENKATRLQLADFLQRPVRPVRLNRYEIDTALEAGFGAAPQVRADLIIRPRPPSARPDAVELVDRLLADAVARKASDIHLETYADDVDLRLRIDGILHQAYTDIAPTSVTEVVNRIKVLANLDIAERRRPQDGRMRAVIERDDEHQVIDFRVSVLRQDPNVMLVGELRDLETGSMALNAAATGHLVLGTLHTADAVGTVARLRGLGLDDTEMADALLAVLVEDALDKIAGGVTTVAELVRVIPYRHIAAAREERRAVGGAETPR
jgi:type II secretory ATPase GspE/PulE/Tfp pilus assembly ATPase PilB-like protein